MNDFIKKIALYILQDDSMSDFSYRQRDQSLINKCNSGFEQIELRTWINQTQSQDSLVILPLYSKRFNVLHEWFESFSFKKISDQKKLPSVSFEGSMLGEKNEYHLLNGEDFNFEIEQLKVDVIRVSNRVFNDFGDLDKLYNYLVKPILTDAKELPNVGVEWAFEYLLLTRIVAVSYTHLTLPTKA